MIRLMMWYPFWLLEIGDFGSREREREEIEKKEEEEEEAMIKNLHNFKAEADVYQF